MQRKLSLSWRLTSYFALLSACVLLVLNWVITASVEQHFVAQDRDILSSKIAQTFERVSGISDDQSLARLASDLSFMFANHTDISALVMTKEGEVLFKTDTAVIPIEQLTRALNDSVVDSFMWHDDKHSYRGFVQDVTPAYSHLGTLIILTALNIDHHTRFMSRFKQQLLLYSALATLVSGLLGWLAAKRGLRPLFLMRDQALNVTAAHLEQRMSVDSVPVEIAGLAQALNDMLSRLEDNVTRLSQFSSDIAHELRTPLSNLMTQTHVALSRPRNIDSYRDVLISNAEEYERLSRMISDMLFLAKADHGLVLPTYEPINLRAEVDNIVEFYELLASEKQVSIHVTGNGYIQGDHLMVRRAISNVLSNAIRHSYDNSEIQVVIQPKLGVIDLSISNAGDTIPEKDVPHLFDRFYRADKNRTKNDMNGVGLGLAITQAIVVSHAGSMKIESANNRSTFTLSFITPQSEP